jgi:hypothetical protein
MDERRESTRLQAVEIATKTLNLYPSFLHRLDRRGWAQREREGQEQIMHRGEFLPGIWVFREKGFDEKSVLCRTRSRRLTTLRGR